MEREVLPDMKKLMLLIFALCAVAVFVPSRAEGVESVSFYLADKNQTHTIRTIEDEAFTQWLLDAFESGEPEEHPCTTNAKYKVAIHLESIDVIYTIYHDSLYNRASVMTLDGVRTLDPSVAETLWLALYAPLSFDIPEQHRALLAEHGWTIAYRDPHMLVKLPDTLAASRTDPAALHFTWADLFLRDAGYDITPYLGQAVVPYVYTLCETVNRVAWVPSDVQFMTEGGTGGVLNSMRAVVLEHGGEIIGAYLIAYSWDGSDLMSLSGHSPLDLLDGQSIRDYLLERLPITAEEAELAALTPEEVIIRYGKVNDPRLMDIRVLLQRLGTASSTLYHLSDLMPVPTGTEITVTGQLMPHDRHMYEIDAAGHIYFPALIYESPETGWKIDNYYNTGI